jgi:hypothetical protein
MKYLLMFCMAYFAGKSLSRFLSCLAKHLSLAQPVFFKYALTIHRQGYN